MLTMGVTRALGDFDLVHRPSQINMKAFISPHPEVQVWPAYKEQPSTGDYLVMATDGLWDVVTNEEVKVFLFILMNHSGWKILDVCKGRGTYELSIAADQGFFCIRRQVIQFAIHPIAGFLFLPCFSWQEA